MSEQAPTPTSQSAGTSSAESVTLDTPIRRGEQRIESVNVRKPKAGQLRGLQLQSVMQGDVNAMLVLLPRITTPPLLPHEVDDLEPEDLAALTGTVMGFFMSKADRDAMMRMFGQTETPAN